MFSSFFNVFSDANKRLHDTNDDLREAVETVRRASPMRQLSVAVSYAFKLIMQAFSLYSVFSVVC